MSQNSPQNAVQNVHKKRKRAERSAPISTEDWERLRRDIHLKYIVNDCTLIELLEWLKETHNIHPSPRQLTLQLNKWEYFKKRSYLRPNATRQTVGPREDGQPRVSIQDICGIHLEAYPADAGCGDAEKYCVRPLQVTEPHLLIFAIPDVNALMSLQTLGLSMHAVVCAEAFWRDTRVLPEYEQPLFRPAPVYLADDGALLPSYSSMELLTRTLLLASSRKTIDVCNRLSESADWQQFVRDHDRQNHLKVKPILKRLEEDAAKRLQLDLVPNNDLNLTRTSTTRGTSTTSFRLTSSLRYTLHISSKPPRDCLMRSTKFTDTVPGSLDRSQVLDDSMTRNLTFIIEQDLQNMPHNRWIFPTTHIGELTVSRCSIFELMTICFEIFYGGSFVPADASLNKNKPVFDQLVIDLALAMRHPPDDVFRLRLEVQDLVGSRILSSQPSEPYRGRISPSLLHHSADGEATLSNVSARKDDLRRDYEGQATYSSHRYDDTQGQTISQRWFTGSSGAVHNREVQRSLVDFSPSREPATNENTEVPDHTTADIAKEYGSNPDRNVDRSGPSLMRIPEDRQLQSQDDNDPILRWASRSPSLERFRNIASGYDQVHHRPEREARYSTASLGLSSDRSSMGRRPKLFGLKYSDIISVDKLSMGFESLSTSDAGSRLRKKARAHESKDSGNGKKSGWRALFS